MPLGFGSGSPSTLGLAVRAGGLILEANREYAKGRFTEALPLYEEALCMELDSRTRFVVLRNQGRIFLTLANIDELSRAQRRARRAAGLDRGHRHPGGRRRPRRGRAGLRPAVPRGRPALPRAARCFKACVEYDTAHTHVAKAARASARRHVAAHGPGEGRAAAEDSRRRGMSWLLRRCFSGRAAGGLTRPSTAVSKHARALDVCRLPTPYHRGIRYLRSLL